jgi:flagellar biosynthesis/type III secretory pathway protein FliH
MQYLNIKNAVTLLVTTLLTGAVQLIRSPFQRRSQRQQELIQQLAEANWQLGFNTGFQYGQQDGLNKGFMIGQQHIIQQLQEQRKPDDRWN